MKKILSTLLALTMILSMCLGTTFTASAATAVTDTLFDGLPTEGTTKTENGVTFSTLACTGGSANATDGSVVLTSAGTSGQYSDVKIAHVANAELTGVVSYNFEFTPSAQPRDLSFQYIDGDGNRTALFGGGSYYSAGVGYKYSYVYDTENGVLQLVMKRDASAGGDVTREEVTVAPSAGIKELWIRYASNAAADTITFTNVTVTHEYEVADKTDYGTYFDGLPVSGTEKTQNNATLSFSTANSGAAVNNNGVITMTGAGSYSGLTDAIITFPLTSGSLEGTVSYEYYFTTNETVPAVYLRVNTPGATNKNLANPGLSASTSYVLKFTYETTSGDYAVILNNAAVASGNIADVDTTYTPATGITSIFMRVIGNAADTTKTISLTNVKVVYEKPPVTGSGVYLEGLPSSGTSKTENEATFSISGGTVANNGSTISVVPGKAWSSADAILEFDSVGKTGIITYEYDITTTVAGVDNTSGPKQLTFRAVKHGEDSTAINLVSSANYTTFDFRQSYIANAANYKFTITYNTITGAYNIAQTSPVNSPSRYSATIDPATGIRGVYIRMFANDDTTAYTINNVKVSYEEIMTGYGTYFEGLPADGTTSIVKNGFTVSTTGTPSNGVIAVSNGANATSDINIAYNANSSLEALVKYSVSFKTGSTAPELGTGVTPYGGSEARKIHMTLAADTDYTVVFTYNPQTTDYTVEANGVDVTQNYGLTLTPENGISNVKIRFYNTGTATVSGVKIELCELPMSGHGVYFDGVPASGTSKTENGVEFITKSGDSNSINVENTSEGLKLIPAGQWSGPVDSVLKFNANSSIGEGVVSYQFTLKTNTSLPLRGYLRYTPAGGALTTATEYNETNFEENSEYVYTFGYNTATGEWIARINGDSVAYGTVDTATGIESVTVRYHSQEAGDYITLTDAKVTFYPATEIGDVAIAKADGKATASVTVNKQDLVTEKALLIIASYDGTKMVDADMQKITFEQGEKIYSAAIEGVEDGLEVVAFLWGDNLKPLCTPAR